ncbi:hypothetical protein ACEWY4_015099 [Coilia grayii]|uniref:receptor protein-tyrosine kinase n=1 Tax=Coilia grayii TaxID=363190 RepID=A0ABD1JU43_9TELE
MLLSEPVLALSCGPCSPAFLPPYSACPPTPPAPILPLPPYFSCPPPPTPPGPLPPLLPLLLQPPYSPCPPTLPPTCSPSLPPYSPCLGGLLRPWATPLEGVTVTVSQSRPRGPAHHLTRVFYISVSVCCAVIFLVATILAVLHLHSMKRIELDDSVSDSGSSQGLSQPSTQTTQYLRADTPNNATPVTSYPSLRIEKNDLRSVTLMEAKAKVKDIAISRERVTLRDVLHEGTFGRIFHGVLLDEKDPSKEKQVFVKTVKDHASEVQVTMMLTESCKLRGLHHRNLLPISQVCTEDGEKPMVLLPYMNWGNLKLFLRQCKLAEANNPQAISQQDLVHMAIQIACGMSYLARREVIHKDLAARNCVIDDSMQVKITDNALARDLFPMDYHCLGDNENRPVRWMALESLLNNDFSSASDVWAFGVSLWELMTLGQTPYVDIDPFEMAAYLKDGYRIAQPINCPDELFAVMACCWALDPEERPKFQQLVQCLTEFHAALGAYV